jgi:hypothetical protein
VKSRRAQPLERLVDADPCWVGAGGEGITNSITGEPVPHRRGVALMFDCPIHEDCHVCVYVDPPLDGGKAIEPFAGGEGRGRSWARTGGESFDGVTLSPSIRVLGGPDGCEWHGFIRAGRFETCGDSR